MGGQISIPFSEDALDGLEQDDSVEIDYGGTDGLIHISSDELDDDELEEEYGH